MKAFKLLRVHPPGLVLHVLNATQSVVLFFGVLRFQHIKRIMPDILLSQILARGPLNDIHGGASTLWMQGSQHSMAVHLPNYPGASTSAPNPPSTAGTLTSDFMNQDDQIRVLQADLADTQRQNAQLQQRHAMVREDSHVLDGANNRGA